MDGWWECEALDQFFYKIMRHRLYKTACYTPATIRNTITALINNRQNRERASGVGRKHYDKDNLLFWVMLDKLGINDWLEKILWKN
ncbi:MAG: hypothetical protein ACN4GW_13295 [Desulforhopalus sp.]